MQPEKVLIDYVFQSQEPMNAFKDVQSFLCDILIQLPLSSVEVEKQHANLQLDTRSFRGGTKRPTTLQFNSYLMSTVLAHRILKRAIESCALGNSTGKVKRLLKNRVLEMAAPNLTGKVRCNSQVRTDGSVKRRSGTLKGILQLGLA